MVVFLILISMMMCLNATAQIIDGRTNDVTVFHEYRPAVITLSSGKINRQKEANIFLKNSALIYKQGNTVMQANMDVIQNVTFGEHCFIKIDKQLAEVVDTCAGNSLVLVRLINPEQLNNEILNKSTITNIQMGGEQLGITRIEASPDQLVYPVDEIYYFVIGDKHILAHERDARRAAGRKRINAYENVVKAYGFKWTDKDCLMQVLKVLSED